MSAERSRLNVALPKCAMRARNRLDHIPVSVPTLLFSGNEGHSNLLFFYLSFQMLLIYSPRRTSP